MRPAVLYAGGLLLIPLLAGCNDGFEFDGKRVDGSGNVITESRDVTDFDKITLAGEGTVIATVGSAASLTIETDDNLLPHIESSVESGTLRIATEGGIDIDPTDSVTYRVSMPSISALTVSGAGGFEVASVSSPSLSLTLSGAGDIEIDSLIADELDATISGFGKVAVAGQVAALDVTLSGAGSFEGADLRSTSAVVGASGAGSVTVWATDQLEARVSGVGNISYYGSPQLTESVTGVGSINSRGDK